MKEKELNVTNNKEVVNNSELIIKQLKKEKEDEFEEVISINTGKIKRMRFAKTLGFINNN